MTFIRRGGKPYFLSTSNIKVWLTVSNAFCRSTKVTHVSCPCSFRICNADFKLKTASVQPFRSRQPQASSKPSLRTMYLKGKGSLAFFIYLKKGQFLNTNICVTRNKYLLQRLCRVISEMHDEKTNICLGIHKYLYFDNHREHTTDIKHTRTGTRRLVRNPIF